jgi:integrase
VLNEMISEAERGLSVRSSASVGDLLDAWFEMAKGDFSPSTVKETRGFIDRNLFPQLGTVPLSKLKASDLDRFYRRLMATGGAGGRPLSPATVRRIHGILRRALGQGVKWGWLGVNPAAAATPPRVPQPQITPPSGEALGRILKRAAEHSPELACYLLVAAATGARRSEVIALRWRNIDIDAAVVSIERGVVFGPDGLAEKDTKTHAARRVALDAATMAALAAHRIRMSERADMCGSELVPDAFVFSNAADGSECWFPDSVSRSFRRLCALEGLPDVRLHDLRHFVATQLLGAGVDVRTVAGRLGHRNAATTLNVYAHFLEQTDRTAADIIGRVIAGDQGSAS